MKDQPADRLTDHATPSVATAVST